MLLLKTNPSVDSNYLLKRLNTQLNEFTKVPKVVKPANKKTLFKNFGDLCNKQQIVPALHE